ncbi:hypothetical protein N8772_03570 [Rickettsiales bacterium]|nr:hypothetical protein [Rickettsiales bacterium]
MTNDNILTFLPKITLNSSFVNNFLSFDNSVCSMGILEEREDNLGFFIIRPDRFIPSNITNQGFKFGFGLIEDNNIIAIQIVFHFYNFVTYNVILNPNNIIVRKILELIIEKKNYTFFAINSNGKATTFRGDIDPKTLSLLKETMPKIMKANNSIEDYENICESFSKNSNAEEILLKWVCNDKEEYLDLSKDRVEINPTY